MRDYNFFSPYIYSTKQFSYKKLIFPLFLCLLILGISGSWLFMKYQINNLQEEYNTHQAVLESNEYQQTMSQVTYLRDQLAYLNNLENDTLLFDQMIQTDYKVTDELMHSVLQAVPQNIVFTAYDITKDGINISADTTDYPSVAEFEKNLRQLNLFESIVVSSITPSELMDLGYHFEIQTTFGGDLLD
ncbi:MAG: PilN domain-containing protein [Clostridia bacterium]|nr:PilN domain-containing protein [Clostridia bacterium]